MTLFVILRENNLSSTRSILKIRIFFYIKRFVRVNYRYTSVINTVENKIHHNILFIFEQYTGLQLVNFTTNDVKKNNSKRLSCKRSTTFRK